MCTCWRGGGGGECEARGIAKRRMRGGEMLLKLVVGWRASAVRGEEAGCFHEVVGVCIIVAGDLCSATDTLTIDRRVA